jgi:hypothetical protein
MLRKNTIALICTSIVLIAAVSIGVGTEHKENLKPGVVNLSLGDNYTASLKLDNSKSGYDIDIKDPAQGKTNDGQEYKRYEFDVLPKGNNSRTIIISMNVWNKPNPVPDIAYATAPVFNKGNSTGQGSLLPSLAKKYVPQKIDGSPGFLVYIWNPGDEKPINEAFAVNFYYYPPPRGTAPAKNESIAEVEGTVPLRVSEGRGDLTDILPDINSIIESINISGPALSKQ